MTIAALKPRFMPWVDLLNHVDQPILNERDRLAKLLEAADTLEVQADQLRKDAHRARAVLLLHVTKNWSMDEMRAALRQAESLIHLIPLQNIEDADLRDAIRSLEGIQSPIDVLNLFQAHVIRQHNLLSTATDAERIEALRRALTWWNFAASPLMKRLGVQ